MSNNNNNNSSSSNSISFMNNSNSSNNNANGNNQGGTLPGTSINRVIKQIGSARFKSQPDLHNISPENDPSQVWRNTLGQQQSDSIWKDINSSFHDPNTCNSHIKRFVLHYNSEYDQWNKELSPDIFEMKLINIKIKSTPILDKQSVKYITGQFQIFIMNLSKALTEVECPQIPDGLYFICLINILSRSQQNIQILLQENALSHPFQAARLAAYKLGAFKDTSSPAFIKWWPYLQVLLGNCCQIASNFAHEKVGWNLYVKNTSQVNNWEYFFNQNGMDCGTSGSSSNGGTGGFQGSPSHSPYNTVGPSFVMGSPGGNHNLSQSTGSLSPDRSSTMNNNNSSNSNLQNFSYSTQHIFKLGMIAILQDCLLFFNNVISKQPKDSASSFRYLLIDTLGVLYYSSYDKKSKELKTILQCIGRKPYIRHGKKHSSLQLEFNFQLHTLRLIKELINNNIENAKNFIQLKGFQKIEEFVMWTTDIFQPIDQHSTTNDSCDTVDLSIPLQDSVALSTTGFDTLSAVLSKLKFTTYSEQNQVKFPTFSKRSRINQLVQLFQVLHSFTFSPISFSKISLSNQLSGSMVFQANMNASLPANFLSSLSQHEPLIYNTSHDSAGNLSPNQINTTNLVIENDYYNINNNNNNSNINIGSMNNSNSSSNLNYYNNNSTVNNEDNEDDEDVNQSGSTTTTSSGHINISPTSSLISLNSGWSPSTSSASFSTASGSNSNYNSINNNASSNNNNNSFNSNNASFNEMMNNINNINNNSSNSKKYVNNLIIEMLMEKLFISLPPNSQSSDSLDLPIFKDQILSQLKTNYPELQLMILEYLCKIVTEHPNALSTLRKYFIYNLILFSDYFYSTLPQNINELALIDNNNNNSLVLQIKKRILYLFYNLRSTSIQLVQFFATYNQMDNFEEIMVLIDYLKHKSLHNPTQIMEICQVLIYILKSNSANSIKSFIKLKIFSQLSIIIQGFLNIYYPIDNSPTTSTYNSCIITKSRNILFCFLGYLINNEELSVYAAQEVSLLDTLFILLKKPETKLYAQTQIFYLMKLNPSLDSDSDLLSKIYDMYISQFTTIRDDTPMEFGFDLILSLLDGIRTIVKSNPKKQLIFKKFNVFLKIVTVVNADYPKEKLASLCHSVLKTIIVLMVNNPKIKKHFRNHIGYDSIKDVILKSEDPVSELTMNIIFDMIVDDEFDFEYNFLIQNSDAVLLLFNLLCNFPIHLQHKILDTFIPLVKKCTTNQSVCCNCHLIYNLLEAIHKNQPMEITNKILELIQELGYHSVTVRELKKLFGLLKSEQGEFRPQLTSTCLNTLSKISVRGNQGPKVYFDFDGKDSCIKLPTFDRWPFAKGFTFCTWVRIESFTDPTGRPEYRPRLFSFLSDSGCGIEVLFSYQSIQVLTVNNGSSKQIFTQAMNPPSFEERKWYFVCIVYSINILSSNEIRVFIDGQLRIKAPIKLSFTNSLMNKFKIGNNCAKVSGERCNPLYGQMGAFNIFDDSLSQSQIQNIYTIGPNFNTSFQDIEGVSTKNTHTFDSSLTNHLFLNYNCRAIEGELCLDNSPDIGGDRNYDATLCSINPCVSRDIKDIIYCLGGIKVLFPLIHQISNMSASLLNDPQINSSKLTIQVLTLFKDMLYNSDANQEEMLRCSGFQVMGYLLQQIQPENLTNGALNIFKDMSTQISDPYLVEEIYIYLLLDFRIWVKTKYEVQKSLFNMLKQIIYDKYEQVKEIITVQKILDIMNDFYFYEIPRQSSSNNNNNDDDGFSDNASCSSVAFQNRDIILKRPQITDITDLRKNVIFEILRHLLRNTSTQDVSAISRFLIVSLDSRQSIEMMQFIVELLNSYQINGGFQFFFEEFVNLGATDIFLTLLRKEDEKVRMAALQLLSKIHYLILNNTSSQQQTKLKKTKIFQDSIVIASSLQPFPLTDITYRYLLAFTLGFNFTPVTFNSEPTLDDLNLDGCTEIKHPEILGVILQLLSCAETTLLRQQILQEIKLLIVYSSPNRSSWIQIDRWSDYLFSIINDTEVKSDVQYSNVSDLIIDIMKILSIHSFHEPKPGYKTLEQIIATLRPYGDRGVLDYHSLTRTLLMNIVTSIKSEANTLASESNVSSLVKKTKKSFSDNLIQFLILTEEFIFYSPKDDISSISNSFLPIGDDNLSQSSIINNNNNNTSSSLGSNSSITPPPSPNTNNNNGFGTLVQSPIPIHNSNLISFFGRLHLSSSNEWEDLEFIKELLDLTDLLKLYHHQNETFSTSNMQPVSGNLKSVPLMFSIHHHRIILRLTLEVIKDLCKRGENVNTIMPHTQRLKLILEKDLHSKSEESNQRCIFTLSHLLKSFKSIMDPSSNNLLKSLIVPYIKDLLRKSKSAVTENLILRKNINDPNVGFSSFSSSPGTSSQDQEIASWVVELTDTTRTIDFCNIAVTSPRWMFVCEYIETTSQSLFFNEEKLLITLVEKRKKKANKHVQNLDDKEAESFTNAKRKADSDLKAAQLSLFSPEVERRSLLLRASKEAFGETSSNWRKILRSLTNERGPWGTLENSSNLHWKLDKTESFSRMRYKLKRNYKFDEHANCSINDDLTNILNNNDSNSGGGGNHNNDSREGSVKIKPALNQLNNEEDDWYMVNDDDNINDYQPSQTQQQTNQKEKMIYSSQCEWITPMNTRKGKFEITSTHIIFTEEASMSSLDNSIQLVDELKYKRWSIDNIKETHLRRYLLKGSALEIFMKDKTNYFFNFKKNDRNKIYSKINSARGRITNKQLESSEILKRASVDWQQRKINNFDYLMILNTAAGRTFNDLTQYPVFPWVIADYSSTTLDLTKPETFRDLSKPIGALNEKRLEIFKERFECFDDPDIPKFHYGSHYSSAGIVLYYLIRLEPFTTHFLQLQGGRFDHADRMFDSIAIAWENSLTSSTDVKELIPEFFYQPEFLTNHNNFNLGTKQSGELISDVQLPPWANSPHDFIRLNREALESEYVSSHLHEWIDLIFGIKQRGRYAEEAINVFYYLTYEGSVDIETIDDENTRKATESQINNFGQTPTQLFPKKHHSPRDPLHESQLSIPKTVPSLLQAFLVLKSSSKYPIVYIFIPEPSIASSYLVTDKVTIIDKSRSTTSHKWFPNTQNEKQSPFTFELDSSSTTKRRIGLPFANDVSISQNCFAITNDSRYVISCGHWDNSFKLSHVESAKLIQSTVKHKDSVTCLALASDDQILVTGSKDTTVMVWKILYKGATPRFDEVPTHILYGHDDEITCVDVNVELDISISGSKDGTCIIHNLRQGEYVRSIYLPKQSPISLVTISNQGYIIIYSQSDLMIYLYSINGKLLKSISTNERLHSMIITKDSEFLITGGEKGTIVIRTLYNLKPTNHKLVFGAPVHSITMSSDQRHLMVGLSDGRLLIICKSSFTKS